jgi:hypothetical protein
MSPCRTITRIAPGAPPKMPVEFGVGRPFRVARKATCPSLLSTGLKKLL